MLNTIQTNEQLKEARREAQRLELLRQHLAKPTAERVRQLLK